MFVVVVVVVVDDIVGWKTVRLAGGVFKEEESHSRFIYSEKSVCLPSLSVIPTYLLSNALRCPLARGSII